ncbi:MAG: biotin carboxylase N-terminal domain-containing protein [bacterium]|nr:ATP-grasp domain-containing protein [Planctomycetota bacterium]HIL51893.1 ATP-grasp domain-containing protein [Planctomycetota bacterium]
MFKSLLIANRGEVAARVARTARKLGVRTVCVASSADLGASWLEAMDEVVCVGPAAARDSYLDGRSIVQAALQTGCAAVHPGWGFLAENSCFAALCAQHSLAFVGPGPGTMEKLGLKIPAKRAMAAAGLDGIPGSLGLLTDLDEAKTVAERIGYPVILKADAGGGGRGMRRAFAADELEDAWQQASAEAQAAFASGALYMESYITSGRHIEVQILCDAYGRGIHLGDRECSIQRNHQKLIEESPSPALTAKAREELGLKAAAAATSIGYCGAGTVEFLLTPGGELFFMEMNARLQVEHPVTEMQTGVDLVEQQLKIAANEALGLRQQDVVQRGATIECRINAEDPGCDFRPTPGTLSTFELPNAVPGTLRVETHLCEGDEISPHYDSLLAKILAHGDTRAEAIETMLDALRSTRIEGVSTTIALHLAVLESPEFRSGKYDTASIPGWALSEPRA